MAQKIVLVGGTGFVGSELGIQLVAAGFELVLLTRRSEEVRGTLAFPATLVEWDGKLIPSHVVEEAFGVVNLAGASLADGRWSKRRKEYLVDSRTKSTRAIAAAIENSSNKPKVWIQASAIGFYGDRGDETLDESSTQGDGFLAETCRAWEEAGKVESVRQVICRIGVVLGHGKGALEQILESYGAGVGATLGSGKQWLSWIHVKDLCRLVVHCLRQERCQGVVNAVSGTITYQDLHETLAGRFGAFRWMRVPSFVLKLVLGEKAAIVLSSQRVQSKILEEWKFQPQFTAFAGLLEDLSVSGDCRGLHFIEQKQWIEKTPKQAWEFFSVETNLEKLTPKSLGFQVLNKSTEQVEAGTEIRYRLSIHGIPLKWKTLIDKWDPPHRFHDIQTSGPYHTWDHEHEFEGFAGGTLMRDFVKYRLPLHPLGSLFGSFLVRLDVSRIFQFRKQQVAKLLK